MMYDPPKNPPPGWKIWAGRTILAIQALDPILKESDIIKPFTVYDPSPYKKADPDTSLLVGLAISFMRVKKLIA